VDDTSAASGQVIHGDNSRKETVTDSTWNPKMQSGMRKKKL
jgi:hypothetical protein